jgi:hypothetical protein
MDGLQSSTESILGFLAVRQREPHGFFGGYLVVNSRARPLEFHCTLPVQPTRAQQILYGATLTEYICGELIARALLGKAAARPQLVLTDCYASLAVRHWMDQPLLHVAADTLPSMKGSIEDRTTDDLEGFTIPELTVRDSRYVSRQRHNATFSCLTSYGRDMDGLDCLADFEGSLDLLEPFSRIVEALAEAHPRSRAA